MFMQEAIQLDQRRRLAHPEETTFLDLLRTTDMLSRGLIAVLKRSISRRHSTTCRILRGAPEGCPAAKLLTA